MNFLVSFIEANEVPKLRMGIRKSINPAKDLNAVLKLGTPARKFSIPKRSKLGSPFASAELSEVTNVDALAE